MKWLSLLLVSFNLWSATTHTSDGMKFTATPLLQRDDVIWGFDFLKDGRIIFTERGGKLFTYDMQTAKLTAVSGVPKVYDEGQGGLLDVRVHPTSGFIYFTFSEPLDGKATTSLIRAKLVGQSLVESKKLFTGHEANKNSIHFGSRIEFVDDYVFFTMGDRDKRDHAQSLKYHQGKVLRLKLDGAIPQDNPFVKTKDALPEIWSYGHRNPQGLVYDQRTKTLWEAEFGPRGGDELNLIEAGRNYGWPVVTFGREYYGPKIGEGTSKSGMESPIAYWVPSISPSAVAIYHGDKFSQWEGNFLLACLGSQHLHRVVLQDKKIIKQEELLNNLETRWRNIRVHSDGFVYLSTDDGSIVKLVPVP